MKTICKFIKLKNIISKQRKLIKQLEESSSINRTFSQVFRDAIIGDCSAALNHWGKFEVNSDEFGLYSFAIDEVKRFIKAKEDLEDRIKELEEEKQQIIKERIELAIAKKLL